MNICIVGAGCIGLTTALEIQKQYGENMNLTIVADKYYDETTTYGSGGLLAPYYVYGTPDNLVDKWFGDTFDFFHNLWYSSDAGIAGVQLVTAHQLYDNIKDYKLPSWSNKVINFKVLDQETLKSMGFPNKFIIGYSYETYVVDQKYYLLYQMNKLKQPNITFMKSKLETIDDVYKFGDFDIIINCCGIGATTLENDHNMYPIRGQVCIYIFNIYVC
jgi:hypothetical protein